MQGDPFGNLEQWGQIIAQIQEMVAKSEGLDEVQPGLVRLLRYPNNWQLREQALLAAQRVPVPGPLLVAAVAAVMADRDIHTDARVLAARVLGDLAGRSLSIEGPDGFDPGELHAMLKNQLAAPEVPVLHRAVEEAVEKIGHAAALAAV